MTWFVSGIKLSQYFLIKIRLTSAENITIGKKTIEKVVNFCDKLCMTQLVLRCIFTISNYYSVFLMQPESLVPNLSETKWRCLERNRVLCAYVGDKGFRLVPYAFFVLFIIWQGKYEHSAKIHFLDLKQPKLKQTEIHYFIVWSL